MKILSRLKYFLILGVGALIALLMLLAGEAHTVSAEGMSFCNGKMMGTANFNNPNGGTANFDSHPDVDPLDGVDPAPVPANLSILGISKLGYAPADEADAACIDFLNGADKDKVPPFMDAFLDEQYPDEPTLEIEFLVKGYVWNHNLGFVSLYCEVGADGQGKNQGKACGAHNYGVGLTKEVDGIRKLVGYAWNQTVGYISFGHTVAPSEVFLDVPVLKGGYSTSLNIGGNVYKLRFGGWAIFGSTYAAAMNFYKDGVVSGSAWYAFGDGNTVIRDGIKIISTSVNTATGNASFDVMPEGVMPEDASDFGYGVYVENNNLQGHAYSAAQMYLDFDGVRITLPQETELCLKGDPECEVECDCDFCSDPDSGEANICVEPDPLTLGTIYADLNVNGGAKVADGVEGYQLHLVLRDDLHKPTDDFAALGGELEFVWKDTVKRNQLAGQKVEETLKTKAEPWGNSPNGAVVKKPIKVTASNFSSIFKKYVKEGGGEEVGHFVLKTPIQSYAPTTNGNISFTVGTSTPMPYRNEDFIYDVSSVDKDAIEANELVLQSVVFKKPGVNDFPISPNGNIKGVSFKFKPAIEIDTLYSGNMQDEISAFRGIPIGFDISAKENSNDLIYSGPTGGSLVKLVLDFEEGLKNNDNFKFNFLDKDGKTTSSKELVFDDLGDVSGTFAAMASLPDTIGEDEEFENLTLQGPSLYSEISYKVGSKEVKYYNNKLPKVQSSIANPAVVVHGNVYAPKAFSPNAAQQVQETGHLSVDVVRNTVNENVKKYLLNNAVDYLEAGDGSGECGIHSLYGLDSGQGIVYCDDESDGNSFEVGGEKVLYFKNQDVRFMIPPDPDSFTGDWVVVVEDGNVFIDTDVYNSDSSLAIISLKTHGSSCSGNNVYIDADVQNIQANIAADCSVFSYDFSLAHPIDDKTGLPNWVDSAQRINSLSKQLYIQGSVASRNTIGGADLDKYSEENETEGKQYLLLGTGEVMKLPVSPTDRLIAQAYDLNYLRLFKLEVVKDENGYPIDQSCGKGLTIEEMMLINKEYGQYVMSIILPIPDLDPPVVNPENGEVCDGIHMHKYNSISNDGTGDLVVPEGLSTPVGLTDENLEPVYIYYRAPKSFVFKKAETVSK